MHHQEFDSWKILSHTFRNVTDGIQETAAKHLSQTAHPRCANVDGGILSPHGALRAYTVLLTAEPRRGSLMMKLFLVSFIKTHQFLPL